MAYVQASMKEESEQAETAKEEETVAPQPIPKEEDKPEERRTVVWLFAIFVVLIIIGVVFL